MGSYYNQMIEILAQRRKDRKGNLNPISQIKLMKRNLIKILFVLFLLSVCALYFGNDLFIYFENKEPSQSIGTTSDGSLVKGKRIPSHGKNFTTYSNLGSLIGRTCVHHKVREVILDSYEQLAKDLPDKVFVYGETGWPCGGRIRPHKTHRNGLSVDFMVPVVDKRSHSVFLPTTVFNKFGYSWEFDDHGKADAYQIDFNAIASHLLALKQAGDKKGVSIAVVIFDPPLQTLLFQTKRGEELKCIVPFSTKPVWIRHDEHYHVDFSINSN
jgi:penicillin-insensitive murein DD-endopeptidase